MSGTSPPNKSSAANPMLQRQSSAAALAQQQRMLQVQLQQHQMKMLHQQQLKAKGAINPLAPAPTSLLTQSSMGTTKSKSKVAPKPLQRGSSSGSMLPLPQTTLKAATSSVALAAQQQANTEEMTRQLLAKCDWKDKTIWASRQLLGGNATNGFLRATASVQRIKRQRARQTAQSKQKAALKEADEIKDNKDSKEKEPKDNNKDSKEKDKDSKETSKDATSISTTASTTTATAISRKRESPDQASEEALKKEVMNPRTAKKIRAELQAGLQFCVFLQNSIRNILFEMDPEISKHTPLPLTQGGEIPTLKALIQAKQQPMPSAISSSNPSVASAKLNAPLTKLTSADTSPSSAAAAAQPKPLQRRSSEKMAKTETKTNNITNKETAPGTSTSSAASPGGEGGSTLRRNRRKKLPPCTEPVIELSEVDIGGKRYSRKEHFFRLFECTRFRALKVGDFVAARVSSRDLWILARVTKDYPGFTLPPTDFLKLSEARRDAQFRDKVAIKDVEDKEGGVTMVPRNLVLPLPRTFSEAADWAHRSIKKSRVYAMYPNTTSLYSATVVDNTTYCRGDDDILVVEFDGDEAESGGGLPKYHIPARFVTLIPRVFPAAQTDNNKRRKSARATQVLPNAAADLASPASVKSIKTEGSLGLDDGLGGMVSNMGLDDLVTTDSLEDFGFDFSEAM